jgi:hypothetical protein
LEWIGAKQCEAHQALQQLSYHLLYLSTCITPCFNKYTS